MLKAKTTIKVKSAFEGIHCYPNAPDEVAYLREPHRHMFHIEVVVEVRSDDREIEFIMLKHVVNKWLDKRVGHNGVWNMKTLSCEQVAMQLVEHLSTKYDMSNRSVSVSVSEDNENGACVEVQY